MPPEKPASAYSTPLAFAGTSTSMVTRLSFLPSLGAADSGIRVMGTSKVHSVRGEAGASSGWNMRGGPQAAADGQVLVLRGFEMKSSLHLIELLWIRSGEVVRLTPVFVDVVELPLVRQGRPFLDALRHSADPRLARARGAGEPAVVIDPAAGHDVEELRLARPRRLGIAKRVDHADAVDRILLESVDDPWRRDLASVRRSSARCR